MTEKPDHFAKMHTTLAARIAVLETEIATQREIVVAATLQIEGGDTSDAVAKRRSKAEEKLSEATDDLARLRDAAVGLDDRISAARAAERAEKRRAAARELIALRDAAEKASIEVAEMARGVRERLKAIWKADDRAHLLATRLGTETDPRHGRRERVPQLAWLFKNASALSARPFTETDIEWRIATDPWRKLHPETAAMVDSLLVEKEEKAG